MLGKKKSQLISALDDLRSEDAKKRLNATSQLKEIGLAIGPQRVRTELITFLHEFLDDQEQIVLALFDQLADFTPQLGGLEHERTLIPLLIAFCKTDERRIAWRATELLKKILLQAKDAALETITKLTKTDMVVAKECAVKLISESVQMLEQIEGPLLASYMEVACGEMPGQKIMMAKYLEELLRNAKNKEEVGRILETVYGQGEELTKIYALPALINYYEFGSNSCLTKFKNLSVVNSWRINICICSHIALIASRFSKVHFKTVIEPMLLKFMTSSESELRAASCQTFSHLIRYLSEDELKTKFLPLLKKLAMDPVEYVKLQVSRNLVAMCPHLSTQIVNEHIFPIVFAFTREPLGQASVGVMKNFDGISNKISTEMLEDKIVNPLVEQLKTNNWRIKIEIISVLQNIVRSPNNLAEKILKVLVELTDDRVDAVRLKINQVLIDIIKRLPKEWIDSHLIPKIVTMREANSYFKRQNYLEIIDKTAGIVSEKTLKEVYHNSILNCLIDKVPNVRMKTVSMLKSNNKITNPIIQKTLEKLKEDKDLEVREMARKLRA